MLMASSAVVSSFGGKEIKALVGLLSLSAG